MVFVWPSAYWLVEEVPTESKAQDSVVDGVVGGKEIILLPATCVNVTYHHEEAGMLQMEIGIDVDNGIIAGLHPIASLLYRIAS